MKLIKSSATLTTVENLKTYEIKLDSVEGTYFSQRLSHNVFLNVFLSTSFRECENDQIFVGPPDRHVKYIVGPVNFLSVRHKIT